MAIHKRKILIVVGTRPNIIKITQFQKNNHLDSSLEFKIVHTGQHYDEKMASSFFTQLKVQPDYFLNIPSATANTQIAQIMIGLEKVCLEYSPDLIMAVGDVNSTLAAGLAANKLNIKLAHLESGLRSMDRTMPEEINRIVTDNLSDLFFVTEKSGYDNLIQEGKPAKAIYFVGNTMIDTLVAFEKEISQSSILEELKLKKGEYLLMTMHRPSNVDTCEGLQKISKIISHFSTRYKVVFPVHPRTQNRMKQYNLNFEFKNHHDVILTDPKDYFSFQKLISDCAFVITDSGGVQEETTFQKVPCYTLRPNTERPSTIDNGTNTLINSHDANEIIRMIESSTNSTGRVPHFWDGQATGRIIQVLTEVLEYSTKFSPDIL